MLLADLWHNCLLSLCIQGFPLNFKIQCRLAQGYDLNLNTFVLAIDLLLRRHPLHIRFAVVLQIAPGDQVIQDPLRTMRQVVRILFVVKEEFQRDLSSLRGLSWRSRYDTDHRMAVADLVVFAPRPVFLGPMQTGVRQIEGQRKR